MSFVSGIGFVKHAKLVDEHFQEKKKKQMMSELTCVVCQ